MPSYQEFYLRFSLFKEDHRKPVLYDETNKKKNSFYYINKVEILKNKYKGGRHIFYQMKKSVIMSSSLISFNVKINHIEMYFTFKG